MKKLLFTLCAVLAGFAAYAGSLTSAYEPNTGYTIENNVLTMEPGKTARVFVTVNDMNGIVEGFQVQMCTRDVAGNAYGLDGKVILKAQNSNGDVFTALGMSRFPTNGFGQSQPVEEGVQMYRIIATNTTKGVFWIGSVDEALAYFNVPYDELFGPSYDEENDEPLPGWGCTEAMFTQGRVFRFEIQTSSDWNEEYATLDFDQEYDKVSWHGDEAGKLGLPDLKIKNAKWQAPLEDLTGEIVISEPDENGQVTVTYTGNEDVTITVNGQPYTGPIQLEDGVETTIDVTVSADGYNDLTGSATYTWTAPTQEQTAAPVITYTAENGTLTITATGAQGDAIILNGPNNEKATGTTTASYTVTYDPYVGYNDTWTATAQADGELVSEVAEKLITVAATTPTVAVPEIEFVETKNANGEVTKVEVVVTNYTSYDVYVDGVLLRGEVIEASTEAAKQIHVEAVNDPIANHSDFAKEAEKDYTLNKLRKDVAAPVITTATGADEVTVTIEWPTTDGEHMYNGQYSYPRTNEDYSVNVEAYTAQSANYNESEHATMTISVPKKEAVEQTGQPTFHSTTKPNHNALYITIDNAETEPNATIFYQITYPDGTKSGWLEYTPGQEIAIFGPNEGGQQGTHLVEAYAVAPGKLPSETIKLEPVLGPTTGIDELIDGKAIANVRYFNMAGQEMQEANGMTIVVTTYTDGTTSAVKVMK